MSASDFNSKAEPASTPVPPAEKEVLKALKVSTLEDPTGYRMIDETTVVLFQPFSIGRRNEMFRVSIFDFNDLTKTSFIGSASVGEVPANTPETPFAGVLGAGAIVDAHRALTEQGGKPMPLPLALGLPPMMAPPVAAPDTATGPGAPDDDKPRTVIKGFGHENDPDQPAAAPVGGRMGFGYSGRN